VTRPVVLGVGTLRQALQAAVRDGRVAASAEQDMLRWLTALPAARRQEALDALAMLGVADDEARPAAKVAAVAASSPGRKVTAASAGPARVRATADEQVENARIVQAAVEAGRVVDLPSVRRRVEARLNACTGQELAKARVALVSQPVIATPKPKAKPAAPAVAVAAARPASNPIAAAARAQRPAQVAAAQATGLSEPTLFHSGDLPPFTASGIDPAQLLTVPWQARPTVAAAASQAEAYQLLQEYSGPESEEIAAVEFAEVERDLQKRYDAWLTAGLPEEQLYDRLYPEQPEGKAPGYRKLWDLGS
jgi:hypothetical protein